MQQHTSRQPPTAAAGRTRLAAPRHPAGSHRPPPRLRLRAAPQEQQPDLIERLVGSIFGKKALEDPEPFGMKRLDFDKLPDQKVVLDREAAPLPGDTGMAAAVRPMLAGTQLEQVPLRCAYDAATHGWTAAAFHRCVDGFGAAVVVAVTQGGAVCGGYNPEGWISLGEDRASNGAFLFTWPAGDTAAKPFKLPKVGGPNLAVMDKPDSGPWFGAEGFAVPLKRGAPGQEQQAKSRLGTYYARLPDQGRSLFGSNDDPKKAQLASLQVWVAQGGGVEYTLDGIVWKSQVK